MIPNLTVAYYSKRVEATQYKLDLPPHPVGQVANKGLKGL